MELQNGRAWKGTLEVILSNHFSEGHLKTVPQSQEKTQAFIQNSRESVQKKYRGKNLLNFIIQGLQKFYSEIFGRTEVIRIVLSKSEFDFIELVST